MTRDLRPIIKQIGLGDNPLEVASTYSFEFILKILPYDKNKYYQINLKIKWNMKFLYEITA